MKEILNKIFRFFVPYKGKEVRLKIVKTWFSNSYINVKYSVNGGCWYYILRAEDDYDLSLNPVVYKVAKTWNIEREPLTLNYFYKLYGAKEQIEDMLLSVNKEVNKKRDDERLKNQRINHNLRESLKSNNR